MIKKRLSINLILSTFLTLLFFVSSCNQNIDVNKFNGKWILQEQSYHQDIIFKDGEYNKGYSSDDLIVNSCGKFYVNKNEKRIGITLSLIPNKIISENDTIYQECENLDIIKSNDSILVILKPNQGTRDKNDKFIRVNEILIYKKSRKNR